MKIRAGFVSNSSSSSFCIYGTYMDVNEVVEKMKDFLTEEEIELIEDEPYEVQELIEEKTDLAVYMSEDSIWIGKSWTSVGDDQTGKQFKDSVQEELEKVFGPDVECGTHEEEIYS